MKIISVSRADSRFYGRRRFAVNSVKRNKKGEAVMKNKHKAVRYNKWGYIFLIPFMVVYFVFQLVPMVTTIYNSFFENYM